MPFSVLGNALRNRPGCVVTPWRERPSKIRRRVGRCFPIDAVRADRQIPLRCPGHPLVGAPGPQASTQTMRTIRLPVHSPRDWRRRCTVRRDRKLMPPQPALLSADCRSSGHDAIRRLGVASPRSGAESATASDPPASGLPATERYRSRWPATAVGATQRRNMPYRTAVPRPGPVPPDRPRRHRPISLAIRRIPCPALNPVALSARSPNAKALRLQGQQTLCYVTAMTQPHLLS